jgi:hypothetical protein
MRRQKRFSRRLFHFCVYPTRLRMIANDDSPETIVAEITKHWTRGEPYPDRLISEDFEGVIEKNRERGYLLFSWRLATSVVEGQLIETIVAIFGKTDDDDDDDDSEDWQGGVG